MRAVLLLSFLIAAASASWSTYSDSELEATVTALIDAGTCASVSSNSNCGSNATGFYYSFEYNGSRIVISSGAPDHRAEYDQEVTNPNTRCERWQYAILDLDPAVASTAGASFNMGTTGWIISGGVVFDYRSEVDGSMAYYYEGDTLDPCYGHSDVDDQYHYHETPDCISGSTNTSACEFLGYMDDGFTVYGQCSTYQSCWVLKSGEDGDNMSDYYYDYASYKNGSCGLDKCGGRTVDGTYAYYFTDAVPYVPKCRMGTEGTVCGFTP